MRSKIKSFLKAHLPNVDVTYKVDWGSIFATMVWNLHLQLFSATIGLIFGQRDPKSNHFDDLINHCIHHIRGGLSDQPLRAWLETTNCSRFRPLECRNLAIMDQSRITSGNLPDHYIHHLQNGSSNHYWEKCRKPPTVVKYNLANVGKMYKILFLLTEWIILWII